MTQENETKFLILALLIILALVGGGLWWVTQISSVDIGSPDKLIPDNSSPQTPAVPNFTNVKTLTNVQNVPTGVFNYGGSTSWAAIRRSVDSAIQAIRPEFRLRYVDSIDNSPGSNAGIKMLLNGQLTLAQSSRPILDQEYNQAQQRGFKLREVLVAIDGLAVAVNPNLNISGLTIKQLKSIYTGKITNWKQLGGPNLKIRPYSRPVNSSGTVELFTEDEDILDGEPLGKNVEFVATTTEALRKLADNPGGIYFASAPEIAHQCTIKLLPIGRTADKLVPPYAEPLVPLSQCPARRNQLNIAAFQQGTYPIRRGLFVVIKQNGQIEQQVGEAYANFLLTQEGQNLITEAGFVRIR